VPLADYRKAFTPKIAMALRLSVCLCSGCRYHDRWDLNYITTRCYEPSKADFMKRWLGLPLWTTLAPLAACILLIVKPSIINNLFGVVLSVSLIVAVLAAVHHAEVVAHRIGEPYGTLLLAVAVTVIEVSLIVSLMLTGGRDTETLARDTVFAAVMIILTGIIGLCLLLGGFRYKEQIFGRHGVSAALVTLTAITVLTLILPNYTTSVAGPVYSQSQLIFVAAVSLVLYGTFVAIQAGRHRDFFLPPEADRDKDIHADPPTKSTAITSTVLLLICLTAVILLAKTLGPLIETAVANAGAPKALVGIIVAFVILLPEGVAALRAARKNRLQTSLNLALGSALASIGLTIPAVAIVSVSTGFSVTLGIDTKSTLLLLLALFTIMLSFGTGRTTILNGMVLLLIFAVYLFTTIVP
jgi:Ca2+:H+ antiporter